MCYRLIETLLAGQDEIMRTGDYIVSPFGELNVIGIDIEGNVNDCINNIKEHIDIDELFSKTDDIDIEKCEQLLEFNKFILQPNIAKECVLRFAWLMCKQIINKTLYNSIKFYIYKCIDAKFRDTYRISIELDNTNLVIVFTDKLKIV